jgi:hypothetical protein
MLINLLIQPVADPTRPKAMLGVSGFKDVERA